MNKSYDNAISPHQPTEENMKRINELSLKELKPEDVFTFHVILCDNEIDRDYERFDTSALNKLADLFKDKTGIFDHSMKGRDQTARIFKTKLDTDVSKKNSLGDPYTCVKASAYMPVTEKNKDLISEINAGIKKEVSINCAVNKRICSICGKDVTQSFCEHQKGKVYKNAVCHHILQEPADAYEWSFVAVPAQVQAGVIKSFSKKEKQTLNNILKSLAECEGDLTISKEDAMQIQNHIDRLEKLSEAGKAFVTTLKKDIMRLSASVVPQLSAKSLETICSNLDVDDLIKIRNDFAALVQKSKSAAPQLSAAETSDSTRTNNEFII